MDTRSDGGLTAADFDHFFRAVRVDSDCPTPEQLASAPCPFPWQQRLVDHLLGAGDGIWPGMLDLPTGSGKTAAIDVALFVLACRDDAPRRIVFVVDRRVVVQQAAGWARNLAERINRALAEPEASDPIVTRVARRLWSKCVPYVATGESPRAVIAAELRGGIAADRTWAERPDVPAIITSTVDQVGSQLLFQGYGISASMRPVAAGLLGNDALILLDEVHLSRPFAHTLRAIGRYRRRSIEAAWPGELDRWQVVELSATPDTAGDIDCFRLDDNDRTGTLGRRLAARKPATVVEAVKRGGGAYGGVIAALADYAESAVMTAPAPSVVGVVANRVAIATAVAERLGQRSTSVPGLNSAQVLLLTGRMRPFDRERVLRDHLGAVATGRHRQELTRPIIVVGTQSIEAGADFDFDALVTQSASLDALRQRFGRVDRRGELDAAGRPSANVIVCGPLARDNTADPIYGHALVATENWLRDQDSVDFGIDHLVVEEILLPRLCGRGQVESGATVEKADRATRNRAPSLLPTHLDLWAQNPTPHGAPVVAAWLHGPEVRTDPDVTLAWRDGLVHRLVDHPADPVFVEAVLEAMPIRPDEVVDIPLSHALRWLGRDSPESDLADIEGVSGAVLDGRRGLEPRSFLIIRPDGSLAPGRLDTIRAGDTIVVEPAEGGLTMGSWNPDATDPVIDVSTAAPLRPVDDAQSLRWQRRPPPARLDLARAEAEAQARRDHEALRTDAAAAIRRWVAGCPLPATEPDLPPPGSTDVVAWFAGLPPALVGAIESGRAEHLRALGELCGSGTFALIDIPSEIGPGTTVFVDAGARSRVPHSDRDSSATIGEPVELAVHGRDTASWAGAFLQALGLPDERLYDHPVVVAARYHDIGKADPRFQAQLWEGHISHKLLAKSAIPAHDLRRFLRAREISGYPRGTRHELQSAAMLDRSGRLDTDEGALIGHLVASHHGVGRPFAPAVRSRDGVDLQIDQVEIDGERFTVAPHSLTEVASRLGEWFWHTVRRHGWYGQAWFTAILRLADHQASRSRDSAPGQELPSSTLYSIDVKAPS